MSGRVSLYIDSGAGQSLCSCSSAFESIRPCAIIVVGIAGSMPVHGIGTATFLVRVGDKDVIFKIFNCLLCHGEEGFNLLSVSQLLRNQQNMLMFSQGQSGLQITKNGKVTTIPLQEVDGLFEILGSPVSMKDKRLGSLPTYELTLDEDPGLFHEDEECTPIMIMKSPSKLGKWRRTVLWMGTKSISTVDYDEKLKDFCRTYFSPISQTQTRKTYHIDEVADMQDLSIRYMGVGRDRLVQTLKDREALRRLLKMVGQPRSHLIIFHKANGLLERHLEYPRTK